MTTTAVPLPARTQTAVTRTGGWMAKRGILLVFLQMPVAALMVGYVLRLISFPVASFAVFVSSAAFPAWVSYRISISDDPDEPVHDLHRYAPRALAAVAAFTAALMPVLMAADIDFWRLWSDLGAELTGEPPAGSWSFVAGVVVYGLVATCLATSYFALVRRPRRHRLRGGCEQKPASLTLPVLSTVGIVGTMSEGFPLIGPGLRRTGHAIPPVERFPDGVRTRCPVVTTVDEEISDCTSVQWVLTPSPCRNPKRQRE